MFDTPGSLREIGAVGRTPDFLSEIASAESELTRTVETGLFEQVLSDVYERVDYAESSADWQDYVTRPHSSGFTGDELALADALQRLDAGDDCLRVHADFQVASYAKLP